MFIANFHTWCKDKPTERGDYWCEYYCPESERVKQGFLFWNETNWLDRYHMPVYGKIKWFNATPKEEPTRYK